MNKAGQYKVALSACSDPVTEKRAEGIRQLVSALQDEGVDVTADPGFFGSRTPGPEQKAAMLMRCFQDPDMDIIFDVSGGDLANLVLPYLDFDVIRNSRACFCGYSDLTTVLNAILAKTGKPVVNYQIRNILSRHEAEQKVYLKEKLLPGKISASDLDVRFLRGSHMEGKVFGGNIRCFLKLAGTPYWPDMKGSILLLESLGGGAYQMMTALEQYAQLGVFDRIAGILLGTFSKMEEDSVQPSIDRIVLDMVPDHIPVASTRYIGHYPDARAIVLGTECAFTLQPVKTE